MVECYLFRLPNELLLHLFAPIPTPELLRYAPVSKKIHTIILRILHNRIVAAAELHSHTLLLECFHPSAKQTEHPYFCAYRGTDGLSKYENIESKKSNIGRLGQLRNRYSRFRPHRRELEPGGRRVLPRPGDVPGSRTFPGMVQDRHQGETVKQMLGLEAHELFTQLVAQTNLVKIGPRNGIFTCFVGVEEGVIRVWREWLKDTAAKGDANTVSPTSHQAESSKGKGKGKESSASENSDYTELDLNDPQILWVSPAKNSGIRFNVRERKLRRDVPILVKADEDMPVSYEIEYDGKSGLPQSKLALTYVPELVIRTSHLLLMLEESMVQEDNSSGKAVVFGSFG